MQERVHRRVVKYFVRTSLLEVHYGEAMPGWDNGFSNDASVWIEAQDRDGLERLLRYWVRPPFALDRLHWAKGCLNNNFTF